MVFVFGRHVVGEDKYSLNTVITKEGISIQNLSHGQFYYESGGILSCSWRQLRVSRKYSYTLMDSRRDRISADVIDVGSDTFVQVAGQISQAQLTK